MLEGVPTTTTIGNVLATETGVTPVSYLTSNVVKTSRAKCQWKQVSNFHVTIQTDLLNGSFCNCVHGVSLSMPVAFHGRGGPFHVEGKKFKTPVQGAFLRAGKELGFDVIDPSGPHQIGKQV